MVIKRNIWTLTCGLTRLFIHSFLLHESCGKTRTLVLCSAVHMIQFETQGAGVCLQSGLRVSSSMQDILTCCLTGACWWTSEDSWQLF